MLAQAEMLVVIVYREKITYRRTKVRTAPNKSKPLGKILLGIKCHSDDAF